MKRFEQFLQEDVVVSESPTLSSNVYLYQKSSACTIFIQPSAQIFITQHQIFKKPQPKLPEKHETTFRYSWDMKYLDVYAFSLGYKNYSQQRFGDKNKNPLFKAETQIQIDQIRTIQVGKAQMLTRANQTDAPLEDCVFIDFKDERQRQIIIIAKAFGEHNARKCVQIMENIILRKLLFASGTAFLTTQLSQLKALESDNVDMDSPHHFKALCQTGQSIYAFLQTEMSLTENDKQLVQLKQFCLELKTDHPFWKRIGFQNSKPQTDFRAAGLFGLLAIVYVSNQAPDLLLNGSYGQNYKSIEEIVSYSENVKQGTYNYPIAISVINIAHNMIEMLSKNLVQLQKILLNDYITDFIQIINNPLQLSDIISKKTLIQATSLLVNHEEKTSKEDDSTYILQLDQAVNALKQLLGELNQQKQAPVEQLFTLLMQFAPQIQILPLGPVLLDEQMLSGIDPRFGGQFFKLVGYLALELNRRLCGFQQSQQYVMYQGQFGVLMNNIQQIIQMNDVLGVDDLIQRIRDMW